MATPGGKWDLRTSSALTTAFFCMPSSSSTCSMQEHTKSL